MKEDGALDLKKVRVGDFGGVQVSLEPSCEPAVLLLLPLDEVHLLTLNFVVLNFSSTQESSGELMPGSCPEIPVGIRISQGMSVFLKQ